MLDAVGEKTTECASERGGYVEDGHAALDFIATVPEREQESRGREETRLAMGVSTFC